MRRPAMLNRMNKISASLLLCVLLGTSVADSVLANPNSEGTEHSRKVDVVIALDVSGSMSGLIASAKQRLWDIVNELGRAQPQPQLRISIVSYGNPEYGADTGFVRIDLPFTSDLDAVNQTLFGFSTNGGDEYVARVVSTSVSQLAWSAEQDALRILFVAGNEAATQDPLISVRQATQLANARGIVVNTIYCGNANDSLAAGWREVASMTNGLYASIDQNSAAVANIATPMDEKLTKLNQALNDTYIAYGEAGERYRENQLDQDRNAGAMSSSAIASRVVTKAGKLYDSSKWDLVDAVNSGKALEEIEVENLPVPMQAMDNEEREAFVKEQAGKREALQAKIRELGKDRRAFIENVRKKQAGSAPKRLDEVIQKGLKSLAEAKGFTFEDE
ncbi:MAG: VWA domain-containing protein [Gammaproteobacteria bacterium]|nr:MAG: VWA domain-containing protein [Gammaproteobacteria bacterium]